MPPTRPRRAFRAIMGKNEHPRLCPFPPIRSQQVVSVHPRFSEFTKIHNGIESDGDVLKVPLGHHQSDPPKPGIKWHN